jgi:putative colanic acid biosynthesis UDP-glucose lipid carrier transferase
MVILVLGSWFKDLNLEMEYFFHVSGSLLGNHCFFLSDFTGFIALRLTRNTIKKLFSKVYFFVGNGSFSIFKEAVFSGKVIAMFITSVLLLVTISKFFIVLLSKGIPHTYRKQLP